MAVRAGYKQTEVGVIPEDWDAIAIGDLAAFSSGTGINVASLQTSSSNATIPVYGGNGVAGYTQSSIVNQPTVIIGRVGQKCGEVYLTKGPAWITDNALYPRTIYRKLDIPFFAFLLEAAGLNNVKNRNDLPLITQNILSSVFVPFPPTLAEQEAIAAALSDADALIAALEGLIAKKRQIKQGSMQELLTGKKRLPGFSEEWNKVPLGEFIEFSKGQGLSKNKLVENGKRKCILYGELFTTYNTVINDVISSTNSQEGALSISGDILMPGSTTTSGVDLAIASALMVDNVALGGDVNVLRSKNTIKYSPQFLANYLSKVARNAIAEVTQGTTIHHLYGKSLKAIEVKMPEWAEQTAIAKILSDMDAEIAALEGKLVKARQVKVGMMQELLTGRVRLVDSGELIVNSEKQVREK